MSRFHQRLRQRMQDPAFAAGYQEMDAEIQLIQALDALRKQAHLSTEELAQRIGRQRATLSRLLNADHPNPTLDTVTDMLIALGITAEIHLRPSQAGEAPLQVALAAPEHGE